MAIKGKKKSQRRGSQARRRPASAPRPTLSAREHIPWYRTPRGQLVAAIVGILVIALAGWGVARAQASRRALESRQESLETYTGAIRAVLQDVRGVAGEMAQVPTSPQQLKTESLAKDATRWQGSLIAVQAEVTQIAPQGGTSNVNALYDDSVGVYTAAAQNFELLARSDGREQEQLLQTSTELRDRAARIWTTATGLLDDLRSDAELGRSDLQIPLQPPGLTPPTTGGEQVAGQAGGRPGEDRRTGGTDDNPKGDRGRGKNGG